MEQGSYCQLQTAQSGDAVRYNCCLDATMSVIEGRWKCTILCMLHKDGPLRFSELQRKIREVSSRILSKQLKELEEDGMITRTVEAERKLRVTYSLTSKGTSILPVLVTMAEWGARNQMVRVIIPDLPSTPVGNDLHCNGPSAGSVELAKEDPLPCS